MKKRVQLMIQVNSDDNDEGRESKYLISTAKSAKNLHQLNRSGNAQFRTVTPFDRVIKGDKIQKLEKQKKQLLQSLEILKNGAVSAIVEKEQIIEKLRKLFNQSYTAVGGYEEDSKVQELQSLLQYVKDLEYERAQLKEELDKVKVTFEIQVQEKQQIIDQLTNELNWSTERIQSLEKYDKLLEEKIKVMEESNENLSVLLTQSQECLKDERKKSMEERQLPKNKSSDSFHHFCSDSDNGSNWNPHSTLITKNNSAELYDLKGSMSRSLDESIVESRIQQMKNQHLVQIQDLTEFYEGRIETLKSMCEKYMQPCITSTDKSSKTKLNNTNTITELPDNQSNYSGLTYERTEEKNKDVENILKKNLSLGSFKSGGGIGRMETIDEKEEMENPSKTLRKELGSFNHSPAESYLKRATSDRSFDPSSASSKRSKNNEQQESQKSYKYFEYKAPTFKKNKSQITQSRIQQFRGDKVMQKSGETKGNWQFFEKLLWFASGTIAGGLLLKLGNKIVK